MIMVAAEQTKDQAFHRRNIPANLDKLVGWYVGSTVTPKAKTMLSVRFSYMGRLLRKQRLGTGLDGGNKSYDFVTSQSPDTCISPSLTPSISSNL